MDNKICQVINFLNEFAPEAAAQVAGSKHYAELNGTVLFYPFCYGTLVLALIEGLPNKNSTGCSVNQFFAFHIHEGSACRGTEKDPFAQAGKHFNPQNCPHPEHAGDLPVLLSNQGTAFQIVYTDRFTPQDVIGRTVIIHAQADDYHTQPSGNAGEMVACGEVKAI